MIKEGGSPIKSEPDNIINFSRAGKGHRFEKDWALQMSREAQEKQKGSLSDEEKRSVKRIYNLFNNPEVNLKTSSAEPEIIATALFKKNKPEEEDGLENEFWNKEINLSPRQQEDYVKFMYDIIRKDKEAINEVLKLDKEEWNNFYFRVLRILSEYRKLVDSNKNESADKLPEVTIVNE